MAKCLLQYSKDGKSCLASIMSRPNLLIQLFIFRKYCSWGCKSLLLVAVIRNYLFVAVRRVEHTKCKNVYIGPRTTWKQATEPDKMSIMNGYTDLITNIWPMKCLEILHSRVLRRLSDKTSVPSTERKQFRKRFELLVFLSYHITLTISLHIC